MVEEERVVELRVSNQKAYVWDVEDLAYLRAKYHVCGVLTGTLPHVSQQNVFLGMPLVLMPEEVVLLVEKKLAILVDDTSSHHSPSRTALETWNTERRAIAKAQLAHEATSAKGDIASSLSMSEDAIRKRKAREEKRAAAALAKSLTESETEEAPNVFAPEISSPAPEKSSDTSTLSQLSYTVTVPADSKANLLWYSSQQSSYTSIDAAIEAGIWAYPMNEHERAKCNVFRDLWEKGHYMGGGIKFGGDYLVYPGDPLRYHSHFAATVINSPTADIAPMEIVAHGRLGTATKKAHLLCSWDKSTQTVSYYSIEWAGFG